MDIGNVYNILSGIRAARVVGVGDVAGGHYVIKRTESYVTSTEVLSGF